MSGGGGGVIIIRRLVDSGEFNAEDCTKLQSIADKLHPRCSMKDAWTVARIVYRRLRKP